MFICIKQHLSNIWSQIHEKIKQHWGWVEKSVAYKKSVHMNKVTQWLTMLHPNQWAVAKSLHKIGFHQISPL